MKQGMPVACARSGELNCSGGTPRRTSLSPSGKMRTASLSAVCVTLMSRHVTRPPGPLPPRSPVHGRAGAHVPGREVGHDIGPAAAGDDDRVASASGREAVVARSALERIVALAAVERVVACAADEEVGAVPAHERVVARPVILHAERDGADVVDAPGFVLDVLVRRRILVRRRTETDADRSPGIVEDDADGEDAVRPFAVAAEMGLIGPGPDLPPAAREASRGKRIPLRADREGGFAVDVDDEAFVEPPSFAVVPAVEPDEIEGHDAGRRALPEIEGRADGFAALAVAFERAEEDLSVALGGGDPVGHAVREVGFGDNAQVACVARDDVGAVAAVELVAAGPPGEDIVARAGVHRVLPAAAGDTVDARLGLVRQEYVVPVAEIDAVRAPCRVDDIVAPAGRDGIVARLRGDDVVPVAGADDVVALAARELVPAGGACKEVVPLGAPDPVELGEGEAAIAPRGGVGDVERRLAVREDQTTGGGVEGGAEGRGQRRQVEEIRPAVRREGGPELRIVPVRDSDGIGGQHPPPEP